MLRFWHRAKESWNHGPTPCHDCQIDNLDLLYVYPSRPKIPLDILRIGALILSISTFSSGSLARKAKLNFDFRVEDFEWVLRLLPTRAYCLFTPKAESCMQYFQRKRKGFKRDRHQATSRIDEFRVAPRSLFSIEGTVFKTTS